MKKLKVLDLFSGIGGFSLGLERAGMETVAFCEIDDSCRRVLKKHWPKIPIFRDIKTLSKTHIYSGEDYIGQGTTQIHFKDIDVICGGFPCTDISIAGLKEGLKGEKSGLWKEYKRLIEEIKPRYAIIENVANLRSQGLIEVIQDLWKIGYVGEWHIISARSIGACHLRERIWIVAHPCSERRQQKSESSHGDEKKNGEKKNNLIKCNGKSNVKRTISRDVADPAHSDYFRLWKAFATEKEKSQWWSKATSSFRNWWQVKSPICRVDDGLFKGLDKNRKERIKQLGNAVLPQIPELIGRAIVEFENES